VTDAHSDKDRLVKIQLLTFVFLLVVAIGRLLYIGTSPVPVGVDTSHLWTAVPFLTIGAFFIFHKYNVRGASLFNSLGFFHLAFTGAVPSAALVFYTGRQFPLIDGELTAFDRLLGFDWVAYVGWFDQHPGIDAMIQWAYHSIFTQPFLILLVLSLTAQAERLMALMVGTALALLATCATALFLPALGPYEFFGLSADHHPHITLITEAKMTAPIEWLRAAAFDTPKPTVTVGLISFPSFHTSAAILYAWAAWRTPFFKWLLVALNATMLIATPIHGSHYFVDVIAGVVIAVASIAVTAWAFKAITGKQQRLISVPSAA
jgi:hypothetical protein